MSDDEFESLLLCEDDVLVDFFPFLFLVFLSPLGTPFAKERTPLLPG